MKKTLLTALFLSLGISFAQAQAVPGLISYQGKVVDSSGVGLGTSTPINRKILFRIFDSGTSGTRLWSEEQTVTLSNGDFSVVLGQGIAASYAGSPENPRPSLLTVFGSTDRYLEIIVDDGNGTFNATDTPIAPRQRLVSTAFAIRAASADGLTSGSDFNLKDANHGLGWFGTGKPFNGINVDGPVLYGFSGGALGSVNGTSQNVALRWDNSGRVSIGGGAAPTEKLDVTGNAKVSGNLIAGGAGTFGGGIAAPTVNSGGAGMRLTLYPGNATDTPFGLGIDAGTLFNVVPTSASYKWYGGTTERMSLNGSTGNLVVTGGVTAGGDSTINGKLAVNGEKNVTLYDVNHGLGYYGSSSTAKATFASVNVNGPVLYGFAGGALGTTSSGQAIALRWDNSNKVFVNGALTASAGVTVTGTVTATGNVSASSLSSTGGLSFGGFGANPTEGGTTGNFISFSTPGFSEDFIGYGANTFFMKDSPGGYDTTEPSLVVGANITANGKLIANGKTAAVGEEDLRIIRGTLSNAATTPGTITAGSGFTFTHTSGDYKITFSTQFSGVPTVTANSITSGNKDLVVIRSIAADKFEFSIRDASSGGLVDPTGVSFIAIGPR